MTPRRKSNEMSVSQPHQNADDLLDEYLFDYQTAKPNRFAERSQTVVVLDDVARVFTTSEAVNKALRALIQAMPDTSSESEMV
jgi:hypothetical protein